VNGLLREIRQQRGAASDQREVYHRTIRNTMGPAARLLVQGNAAVRPKY
jgi:hypothetical protein